MELIILGVCLFILLFNVLVSTVRGARKSVLRLLTALLAAVSAFFLSRLLCVKAAEWALPRLRQAMAGNETLAPFFNGEIAVGDAAAVLTEMLVAPLLFMLLYILIKAVLLVAFFLLKMLTAFLKGFDDTVPSRLLGALVGVLIAALGIVVFITPVLGYVDLASSTVEVLVQSSEAAQTVESTTTGENAEETLIDAEALRSLNEEYLSPLLDTPVLSDMYRHLGSKLFDGLSHAEWDGQDVQLKSELATIADIAANIGVLGDSGITAFGADESLAVEHIARDVGASPLLSDLFSGTVSAASRHWLADEQFLGIEKPDMGVNANPLFDSFLFVFSSADRMTVGEDLDFFSDAFALFVEYELFLAFLGEEPNDAHIAALLSDSGLLADVQQLIDEHPRMQPVGDALVDFGMRVLLQEMGLPEDLRESHAPLLTDMSEVLQAVPTGEDGSPDAEVLTVELDRVFEQNGLDVSEEASHLIAEGIADHFTAEELSDLTADDVIDKLIERFDSVDISSLLAGLQTAP